MRDNTVLTAGVSATSLLPIESLTLREAIALVAFGDHRHTLQPDHSEAWSRMAGLDPSSEEGRRLWHEWNRAAIELDQRVRTAVRVLLHAFRNGTLTVAGDLVIDGSPISEINSIRHDPIPGDVLRLPAEIPWEWIANRNGWLLFRTGTVAGMHRYHRYTDIAIEGAGDALGTAKIVARLLSRSATVPRREIKRTDYGPDDTALLPEMDALIRMGKADSAYAAGLTLSGKAQGFGNPMSKAKRLAARYIRWKAQPGDFSPPPQPDTSENL